MLHSTEHSLNRQKSSQKWSLIFENLVRTVAFQTGILKNSLVSPPVPEPKFKITMNPKTNYGRNLKFLVFV